MKPPIPKPLLSSMNVKNELDMLEIVHKYVVGKVKTSSIQPAHQSCVIKTFRRTFFQTCIFENLLFHGPLGFLRFDLAKTGSLD